MENERQLKIGVWCGLADYQYQAILSPLLENRWVRSALVFRRFPPPKQNPKVIWISPPKSFRNSAFLSVFCLFLKSLYFALRFRLTKKPSITFCFGVTAFPHALMARIVGLAGGIPCGAWWIGTDLHKQFNKRWLRPFFRSALKNCDITLTMGDHSRNLLIRNGWKKNRTFSLLIGHDLERFRPKNLPKQWDVINVSRHEREPKRLHILLEAIALVRKRLPNIRCALVGDGPDRERLERLSINLGLGECVTFLGYRSDIPELLNRSKIFAMCSAWEGLPAAMVEAMACGIPVVSNNVSDIPDLAKDGENALLVSNDKPINYASNIYAILTNEKLFHKLSQGALRTRERLLHSNPQETSVNFWDNYLKNFFD